MIRKAPARLRRQIDGDEAKSLLFARSTAFALAVKAL
jgi:hypothetical protein